MPNRQADLASGYVDPHGVFSPKSTDPSNLGINMCINILDGDNSPRVKDNALQNVTQHMQTLNIRVRRTKNSEVDRCLHMVGSIPLAIVRRYH